VIPLFRQYWLVNGTKRKVSLYPYASRKEANFRVIGTGYKEIPSDFDPGVGTISKAVATCIVCGSRIGSTDVRELFNQNRAGERMIVAVTQQRGTTGKKFRTVNEGDMRTFEAAEKYFEEKKKQLVSSWGLDPFPDEPLPVARAKGFSGFRILLYGKKTWGDLFNTRQKLALIVLIEKVRDAYGLMVREGYDAQYAKAIVTYLALLVDGIADHNSSSCRWRSTTEDGGNTFGRQALPMTWDYFEINPLSGSTGSIQSGMDRLLRVIEHLSNVAPMSASVTQSSATSLPYADNFFDAVFTDPPYYDNVAYADLSDFFYVLLKRSIGNLYPELFTTMLTPKSEEIIQDPGRQKGKQFFEVNLTKSLHEVRRVLRPGGIAVIVYAHKSTDGWETLINSLQSSGLAVTSSWPIHTEMKERLVAMESGALASSIYMVTRKFPRQPVGFYKEVKESLKEQLDAKLDGFWQAGISGADFFIAAIGSSIEVLGKFDKIIDDEGNSVKADKLLEDVRRFVTEFAVRQVLHNGIAGEITPMTRFYVLWRWAYGDVKLEFDDAKKLAQGVGIDLTKEWNHSFIRKDKEFVRALGPEDREPVKLEGSRELIDVLHRVLLLWKKGKNEEILRILVDTGFGNSEVFYKVAHAVSESLPSGSREKKLLEGFLQGRGRISEDIRRQTEQTKLSG